MLICFTYVLNFVSTSFYQHCFSLLNDVMFRSSFRLASSLGHHLGYEVSIRSRHITEIECAISKRKINESEWLILTRDHVLGNTSLGNKSNAHSKSLLMLFC